MMLEAIIYDYLKLGGGYMLPTDIAKKADEYHKEFATTYERLFKQSNQ
jgi:hypothetical protein